MIFEYRIIYESPATSEMKMQGIFADNTVTYACLCLLSESILPLRNITCHFCLNIRT